MGKPMSLPLNWAIDYRVKATLIRGLAAERRHGVVWFCRLIGKTLFLRIGVTP